ncbi:MAG: ImmA/IrrE family metallo-endopeptidase [Pyrinomonadaceae bacterium]|nr:ImmA/IrrE family metallo-endopeptidase [Pyrinomonadaceae bacterium]
MNFVLTQKLKDYGFNERAMSEADFYTICESENIKVIETDAPTSFYFSVEGNHFIIIKKSLKGLRKTFSMFHELAHYFLHGGDHLSRAYFYGMLKSKNEFEADALAVIALLPRKSLKSFDFLEEHPNRFARKLYQDRQKLEFLYGV